MIIFRCVEAPIRLHKMIIQADATDVSDSWNIYLVEVSVDAETIQKIIEAVPR